MPTRPDVAAQVRRPLDALNFFLADVRDGLGPYLAIYLLTVQRWDEASIGVVMSIATLAGLLAQTPAGALVDATRAKRALVAGAALVVTIASLVLPWVPSFWPVALSQATAHAAAAILAPAIAAITLGTVGHAAFSPQRILQSCRQRLRGGGGRDIRLHLGAGGRLLPVGRDVGGEPLHRVRHPGECDQLRPGARVGRRRASSGRAGQGE
jgi:hypothetical protein